VLEGLGSFTTKERTRTQDGNGGFKVFGEKAHRDVAVYLTGVHRPPSTSSVLLKPNAKTSGLQRQTRGVMLLYPVRESEENAPAIGFEVLYPDNDLGFDINFTVRKSEGGK